VKRWAVLLIAVLLGSCTRSSDAPQFVTRGQLQFTSCAIEGVEPAALCGSFEVPENRGAPDARRILLKIVVLPAIDAERADDPVFILAGGPGQAASDNADFFARIMQPVRQQRDIVLVDQRGTGGSNPLPCDLYGWSVAGHLADLFPLERLQVCAGEWQQRADTRHYTTDVAMRDLDDVRQAMGYTRVNLFGTSYGTRAAQVYMREFPERVRTVTMKGVTPLGEPFFIPMARDAQRALELTFDDCAADAACAAAFPNLRAQWAAVLQRLDEGNVEVELEGERVTIGRAAVAPTIRSILQSTDGAAQLPRLIAAAAGGDFHPLAEQTLRIRRALAKGVHTGMFLAVAGAEDIPFIDAEALARDNADTYLRDYYYQQARAAAALLPLRGMPADYHQPVKSNVPTLLISGFLDSSTPPAGAQKVAQHLPNSAHVVVRNGSHSYGGMSPCIDNIMAEFIARGSVEKLDTSCADNIQRPPFALPENR
jgi:pimeloyl-ACP methyl ester carboxylesterase